MMGYIGERVTCCSLGFFRPTSRPTSYFSWVRIKVRNVWESGTEFNCYVNEATICKSQYTCVKGVWISTGEKYFVFEGSDCLKDMCAIWSVDNMSCIGLSCINKLTKKGCIILSSNSLIIRLLLTNSLNWRARKIHLRLTESVCTSWSKSKFFWNTPCICTLC